MEGEEEAAAVAASVQPLLHLDSPPPQIKGHEIFPVSELLITQTKGCRVGSCGSVAMVATWTSACNQSSSTESCFICMQSKSNLNQPFHAVRCFFGGGRLLFLVCLGLQVCVFASVVFSCAGCDLQSAEWVVRKAYRLNKQVTFFYLLHAEIVASCISSIISRGQ